MTRLFPCPQPITNDALSTNAIINAHVPAIAITRFASERAELHQNAIVLSHKREPQIDTLDDSVDSWFSFYFRLFGCVEMVFQFKVKFYF